MICWFENSNNDITSIDSHVFFLSSVSSRHSGYYIDQKNFRLNMSIYVARGRDVINRTWINNCDRYYAPIIKDKIR
jgi:23S rRNA G2069 N7-methylase RlmK/C1962 C5-methylase RlmI